MEKLRLCIRKSFICTLAVFMSFSMLTNVKGNGIKADNQVQYEIYPNPQEIVYENDSFVIRSNVNVVYETGIDDATKNKLQKVLETKGITLTTSDKKIEGATNILVGLKDSKEYVDSYAKENLDISSDLFTKIDPYILDVNDGTITILGETTDSAFYGIVSLMHILNQIDGKTVQNLRMNDYADTKTRGFIEGYYGIPWTDENRMSLMEFGGDFKMNMYTFAPKDDPYHSARWRDPYPADKLEEIRKMAKVGNDSKTYFTWTIHPFMNGGITAGSYDADIIKIKAKFDQLYEVGVRQFGVLGDDAGNLPRDVVSRVMNDLQDWVESKGDVKNLVFCPAGYNNGWWIDGELSQYDKEFNEDIQIFWTGNSVCSPVNQSALDNFKRRGLPAGDEARRSPLFWLNWPVNDINIGRLMMGKGSLLDPTIKTEDVDGIVTNPMQDAQASKVALFAIADYAWNVGDFNDDQSWEDSFKYIDPDAATELHTIAKHMSDPAPNGHGLVLDESEDLKPLLEAFLNAYENDEPITDLGNDLIKEFEIIRDASDDFHKKSKNENMKSELLPFTNSLKDLSEASISFIKTAIALENNDFNNVWANYSLGTSKLENSKHHLHEVFRNGQQPVSPSSKRIVPFVTKMSTNLAGPVNAIIDDSKIIVTPITNRKDTPQGSISNMIDGNPASTTIWKTPNSAAIGEYVGIKFNRSVNIKDIQFLMSTANNNSKDTFAKSKIEYTEDGTIWKDLPNASYDVKTTVIEKDGLDLNVKGIRLISTAATSEIWLTVREISYNKSKEESAQPIQGQAIHSDTMKIAANAGSLDNLTDGNLATGGQFAKFPYVAGDASRDAIAAGNYIGLEFEEEQAIGTINLHQGYATAGNIILKLAAEYSIDGTTWTLIKNIDAAGKDVTLDAGGVQAKYIRFRVLEGRPVWWDVNEISAYPASAKPPLTPSVMKTASYSLYGTSRDADILDGNPSTFAWYVPRSNDISLAGDFVGLDLGREVLLGKTQIIMGNGGDYWNAYDLEYSMDGVSYTKYQSFTQDTPSKTIDLDLSAKNIKARYVRIKNTQEKKIWLKLAEFTVKEAELQKTTVYTNSLALKGIGTVMGEEVSSIVPTDDVLLAPQEYIGIELTRLRDLSKIICKDVIGLTLQTSKNGIVWSDVSDKTRVEDARYVRLINLSEAPISFDLTAFEVHSNEVYPISVKETNFADESTHLNVFDSNLNTEAVLQSSQVAGKYIIYDLGQEINLTSLKAILHDSTTDFPRHAKITGSLDGNDWSTIMEIGDQNANNPGEAENTDVIGDVFPLHEISFNAKLADELDMNVRYIKFEITRTKAGADKWTRFREFELNGGELYLPSTNDPTIETNAIPVVGYEKENLRDGDVSSIFKPANNAAGYLTYNLLDVTGINKVTILQSPKTISNARVYAEVVETTKNRASAVKWVELGKLSNSLNEFNTSAFANVLSIKIDWDTDSAPELHELLVSKAAPDVVSKDALNNKITEAKAMNTSTWTPASVEALKQAIEKAEAVSKNNYVTNVMVDGAISTLTLAITNKIETGNLAAFTKDITDAKAEVLTQENYVARTWQLYSETLTKVEAAQTNKELSQADLDMFLADFITAKDALVYEVISIENFAVLLEDAKLIPATNYTKKSYSDLTSSFSDMEAMIAKDKVTRVKPSIVKENIAQLATLKDNLVDLQAIRAEIALSEQVNEAEFTGASFKALKDALNEAQLIEKKENASAKEVGDATTKLVEAREGLVIKADTTALKLAIARLKEVKATDYTTTSYKALSTKITEIEEALKDTAGIDQTQLDAFASALSKLETELVSVQSLNTTLAKFDALKAADYTKASYNALEKKVNDVQALFVNGTKEAIAAANVELQTLIDALEKVVSMDTVKATITSYEAIDGTFTKDSKDAYLKAIADAKTWLSKEEITEAQLKTIVASLDEAKDQLVSTTKLQAAIDKASKIDGSGYTNASFARYQQLITDAKALFVNGTNVQISDMIRELENTSKYLVAKADTSKLLDLYNKYSKLDLSIYTETSATTFRNELVNTSFILSVADASDAQIQAQMKALENAYKALALKDGTSVDTSDTTNIVLYFGMFLLAGAFAIVVRKKTKKQ